MPARHVYVLNPMPWRPSNDLEAAFLGDFSPGRNTAIISGKNGGTGVSVVEIFKLPDL